MEKFSPRKADKEVTTIRIPKDVLDVIDKKSAAYCILRCPTAADAELNGRGAA